MEDVIVGQKKIKQIQEAVGNISEQIIKVISRFCIVLSSVVCSSHYLSIFSPQPCEVVSGGIVPIIIQLKNLRLERLSGLPQSQPAKCGAKCPGFLTLNPVLSPYIICNWQAIKWIAHELYLLSVGDGIRSQSLNRLVRCPSSIPTSNAHVLRMTYHGRYQRDV